MTRELQFMLHAVSLARQGMENHEGGPFGCIIVKGDEIVGRGSNKVTSHNDPTAHAEIVAIRDACRNLNTYQLRDCEIYCSCEPCPMCLGALYWARPKAIYYANTRTDAASIGFDDSMIYEEVCKDPGQRKIPTIHLESKAALEVFQAWKKMGDKKLY